MTELVGGRMDVVCLVLALLGLASLWGARRYYRTALTVWGDATCLVARSKQLVAQAEDIARTRAMLDKCSSNP